MRIELFGLGTVTRILLRTESKVTTLLRTFFVIKFNKYEEKKGNQ